MYNKGCNNGTMTDKDIRSYNNSSYNKQVDSSLSKNQAFIS